MWLPSPSEKRKKRTVVGPLKMLMWNLIRKLHTPPSASVAFKQWQNTLDSQKKEEERSQQHTTVIRASIFSICTVFVISNSTTISLNKTEKPHNKRNHLTESPTRKNNYYYFKRRRSPQFSALHAHFLSFSLSSSSISSPPQFSSTSKP